MHHPDIDINLVLKLDALLRERNVTKAARQAGITQSAMSHALGRLREQLRDRLLVRTGSGMVLTPKAEALAPRVARLVWELTEIWSPTSAHEPAPLPRLFVLSAGEAVQMMLVPSIAAILQAEAAHAGLVVLPAGGHAIELLRRGASDLALGRFGALPPDIHQQALMTDELVCLVRQGHPAVAAGLTPATLAAFPHVQVGVGEPIADLMETHLATQGLMRRIGYAVTSYEAALALVAASDAILTLPRLLAERMAPRQGLAILAPPLRLGPWTLAMAWHARASDQEACAWLRQMVIRAATQVATPKAQEPRDAPVPAQDVADADEETAPSNRRGTSK